MDDLQIFDCDQGEAEWFEARRGIPTASMFATVMAKGKGAADSKTRRTYMLKLIGENLTGEVQEGYSNGHMERGKIMEPDARNLYAMVSEVEPVAVGFMRRGQAGASPDSLIETNGLLEIKTKLPHLHLEVLLSGEMPPEHKAQVQGQLWISGRDYCDFVSYWPGLPIFIKRIEREQAYIDTLAQAVADFNGEMKALTEEILRRSP